jgi:RND family efflux transporter MFP subunit
MRPAAAVDRPGDEVEVRTAPVRRGAILRRIEAPGSLLPRRESKIGTEVTGRIDHIFVDEGDHVDAGAPLFQIDPEPYQIALRQAQAALDHAKAERAQVESDLARARELDKRQIVSKQELDKLSTFLAVARSAERQATEQVALAQHKLDRTLVHAPYPASIAARLEDEGTTALSQPQTIILVLHESGELEARATIPESRLALVRQGDPALIHVAGVPAPIQTEVFAVGDAIDPATRTYTVKMRVPNPDGSLKAGVFAEVEIMPRSKLDALLVPREAIRSEDGQAQVFTVQDGVARALTVTLGVVSESEAEILQGVRVDTPVIVGTPASQVAPGTRVRVAPEAAGPARPRPDGDA